MARVKREVRLSGVFPAAITPHHPKTFEADFTGTLELIRKPTLRGEAELTWRFGLLLGAANLMFWPVFAASGLVPVGIATASLKPSTARKPAIESQPVASEVEIKKVAALGLIAVSLREHLDEHAVMRGCHASEFLQRCGGILISTGIGYPHPDESDQSSLLAKGGQPPKQRVLSLTQGREVNEKRPG